MIGTATKAGAFSGRTFIKGLGLLTVAGGLAGVPRSVRAQGSSVGVEDYRDFLCMLFDAWYNGGQPLPW